MQGKGRGLPTRPRALCTGSHTLPIPPRARSYNNAAREYVSPNEALLSGVARAAISFCTDANGDGMIELKEGCIAVRRAGAEGGLL